MKKLTSFIVAAFPLWIILGSISALASLAVFTWFSGPWITYGLGIIMLGMGLTLHLDDFKGVFTTPKWVFAGMLLQYTVMPFLGWGLAHLFKLPDFLAVGLILVACCPGGTASNVVTYLARAHVALSVTMTAVSTFAAILMTPLLTYWLVGSRVEVSAWGLFINTLEVVLLPVLLGVGLNRFFPKFTKILLPWSPPVAAITIVLIVSSIIGAGKVEILKAGLSLIGAIICLHSGGFLFGYLLAKWWVRDEQACRTISIEVGMQNSGLGAVLAKNNFPHPATAIPAAISSATHSIIGSMLAGYWLWKESRKKNGEKERC